MIRPRLLAALGGVSVVAAGSFVWRHLDTSVTASHTRIPLQIIGPSDVSHVLGETLASGNTGELNPKSPTATPPPVPSSPAPTNPARSVLHWVDDQLIAVGPTGNKRTDGLVSSAARDLGQSIAGPWSVDGNHLDTNEGSAAFDAASRAATELSEITASSLPPVGPPKPPIKPGSSGTYAEYLSGIDYAMWLVGITAINDNTCNAAHSGSLTLANAQLTAGNSQFDEAHYGPAIVDFKIAWADAIKATGLPCSTFTVAGDLTGLYPGATLPLPLTLVNSTGVAIQVNSVTVHVGNASGSCLAENVHVVGTFSGPLIISAHSSLPLPTTFSIQMVSSPDNSCQDGHFPLTYSGLGVSQ